MTGPLVDLVTRYVRDELGHEEVRVLAARDNVDGEAMALVRTPDGIFGLHVVGNEVVDDTVSEDQFKAFFRKGLLS